MKTLFNVLVLAMALNFLIVIGAVGWLYHSGKLDRAKIMAIRELVLPTTLPTTAPADADKSSATTQPFLQLDALLEKHAGKRAGEQVAIIQQTVDAQTAQLDRRKRELDDLQRQVAVEQKNVATASAALEAHRKEVADREKQASAQAGDKGFADSLKLYSTMPGKQAKSILMTLSDETIRTYLEAMPPRTASRIMKEFKTPEELDRIQRVMEKMRQGQATTQPSTGALAGKDVPPVK